MGDVNICSGIEIPEINVADPFTEMAILQRRLQLRLNPNCYDNNSAAIAAQKIIFWHFCIAAECKELLDWFLPENHSSMPIIDVNKEIQMEAIDILHFVMNVAYELKYTPEEIGAIENDLNLESYDIRPDRCESFCSSLIMSVISLVEVLPWKTWKTYEELTVEDVKPLVTEDFAKIYKSSLQLCCATGLSRQDIINVYFAKNAENHNRQDNGY